MKPIPDKFNKDGFAFELISREGMVATFRKTKGRIESFEVVVLQARPDVHWYNGTTTPAHEALPSSESWGTLGFTMTTRNAALAKAVSLSAGARA
jgi:hypothetical protein